MRFIYVLSFIIGIHHSTYGQLVDSLLNVVENLTTTEGENQGLVVLPAVFYSPESSLGFGVAGIYYFRPKGDSSIDSSPSNVQSVIIYTLENQILFTNPYNIFLDREKHWLKGEVGFYVYPYEYYGIGSDVNILDENAEFYNATYLRIESNYLRRINKNFYIGPTLFLDQYFKISTEANGNLISENVLGIDPSTVFGFGASFILDHRNNLFCPSQGFYLEGRVLRYEEKVIGDYPFTDLYIDVRKYFHPWNTVETGIQLYHQSIVGDPPFYNYALLGGSKRMRGYYKGAYRDNHQTVFQAEARTYLFKRVVFAAFGGVGSVTSNFGEYDKLLGSYGVGLRYEIKEAEHIRIRFDYARGNNTSGFYININEAF